MSPRALIAAMAGVILVLVAVILALVLNGGDSQQSATSAGASQAQEQAQAPATSTAPSPVQAPSAAPLPWEKGRCVNASATAEVPSFDGVTVVPCDSDLARAKILALSENP